MLDYVSRNGGRRVVSILCAAALFVPHARAAEKTGPVSLETAPREAVSWHPSVAEAIARLSERETDIDVARAGYQPQIRAGIGSGYNNVLRSQWRPRTDVTASQMLFDFGKTAGAVESARAGTRVGRANLLLSVDQLVRDTAYAVIEVQRGEALHKVALEQLASIRDISALVVKRYKQGASTKSDAYQSQARVEAAEATLAEIETARSRWLSNLALLLGRTTPPSVTAGAPAWLDTACRVTAPDWDQVPAAMRAEAEREQATAELRRARAEGLPTVSLGAGAGTDVTSPFTNRSEYSLGLNISSSLSSGGAVRARARGANFALGAANAAIAATRNEVGLRLQEARQQIDGYGQLLATLSARQVSMAETGKLYRMQYLELGTRTLVDLLNAEQEYHQVQFDMVNLMHDLNRLKIDCTYHSGRARDSFGLGGMTVQGVVL